MEYGSASLTSAAACPPVCAKNTTRPKASSEAAAIRFNREAGDGSPKGVTPREVVAVFIEVLSMTRLPSLRDDTHRPTSSCVN